MIKVKDREVIALKVKYAKAKTLLTSHGVTTSGILRDTSRIIASGSIHRVRSRMGDTTNSGGNAPP